MNEGYKDVYELLSKREIQILDCILEGMPNKIIAKKMMISERTVKFHCTNIYSKLDVNNRYSLLSKLYYKE